MPRRTITFKDQDPLRIIPHGDRLLLEMLEVDETTESGIILTRDEKSKEDELGFIAGIVVNAGTGHRLDVADQAVALATETRADENGKLIDPHPYLRIADPATRTAVAMIPSTVPMPFARGMVVLVGKYVGTDIKMRGLDYKIVTQAHVIGTCAGLLLQVTGAEEPKIMPATVPCGGETIEAEAYALDA